MVHPSYTWITHPGTTISRINKGLRRRKEKSLFGFHINTSNRSMDKGRR